MPVQVRPAVPVAEKSPDFYAGRNCCICYDKWMKVVTSGFPYIDIDAYGCAIAYAELLNLKGEVAKAVSTSELNESITKTVRSWGAAIDREYTPSEADSFVLVDVSQPEHFDQFVEVDRVAEVIDHHPGYENYWHSRIGDAAQIEFIGAACTQVYENWKQAGLLDKMSVTSARLLVCGILDNTLNFGAKVSTARDEQAYRDLLVRAHLPDDWTATYFSECQESIFADAALAIKNDTKLLNFKTYPDQIAFGQVVVWDGKQVLEQHLDVLREAMLARSTEWMINVVSVAEGLSYFISDNSEIKVWVSNLLKVNFDGGIAVADRLWLRKEVLKADIEINNTVE